MQGYTEKMRCQLSDVVQYQLLLNEQPIPLNPYLGQSIDLQFTGRIACVHCQKPIKKTFNQGYCYACFQQLAQCDLCIMKPETCHYAQGTCREPDWAKNFCFQPHVVYLANSSGLKVGITRQTQLPTRWLDQGATQALPIIETTSRYIAGLIEVIFARHVSDKTNWQQMLKADAVKLDLLAERDRLLELCQTELSALSSHYQLLHEAVLDIKFPVLQYPKKIKSFNFDNQTNVSGTLQGIKGQYLLLDTGVLNLRKFTGYELSFNVS